MPLAPRLLNVMLRHSCPHCGNTTERKGSFFHRATHYTCTSCAKRVPPVNPPLSNRARFHHRAFSHLQASGEGARTHGQGNNYGSSALRSAPWVRSAE